jgi:hypothetical protein
MMPSLDWRDMWLQLGKPEAALINAEFIKFVCVDNWLYIFRQNEEGEFVETDWLKVKDEAIVTDS